MIIDQALLMLSEFFLSEGTGLPPTKLYCDSHRYLLTPGHTGTSSVNIFIMIQPTTEKQVPIPTN